MVLFIFPNVTTQLFLGMALPNGFDPRNMSFGNIANATPVFELPRNTSTYGSSRNHSSLWRGFNHGVASIGNWFAEHAETTLGICSIIMTAVIVITAIVYVIGAWINEGFWIALLVAVVAFFIGSIVWYIGAIVIVVVINAIMYGFRLLFWNGWTLLLALTLGIGGWFWADNSSANASDSYPVQTEMVSSATQTYICTARTSLKVRRYPTTTSPQIGSITRGETVEVLDISDGFAHIKVNGIDGYASLKYLRKL